METEFARTVARRLRRGDRMVCTSSDPRIEKVERVQKTGSRISVRTSRHTHFFDPNEVVEVKAG